MVVSCLAYQATIGRLPNRSVAGTKGSRRPTSLTPIVVRATELVSSLEVIPSLAPWLHVSRPPRPVLQRGPPFSTGKVCSCSGACAIFRAGRRLVGLLGG